MNELQQRVEKLERDMKDATDILEKLADIVNVLVRERNEMVISLGLAEKPAELGSDA